MLDLIQGSQKTVLPIVTTAVIGKQTMSSNQSKEREKIRNIVFILGAFSCRNPCSIKKTFAIASIVCKSGLFIEHLQEQEEWVD